MSRISPNRREAMETFPQDLVVNILSRLPVKYLIQLKCVCKAWRSMISDPHFAKLQLAHNLHRFLFFTLPLGSVGCEGFDDVHNLDRVKHLEYPAVMKNVPGFEGAGIFLHGALHSLASRARNQEEICVVAFDMTEEKFYELVQLPDMEKEKLQRGMFLTISADSLFLFCEGGGSGSTEYLDVWKLNEYGVESSWTRIFSENRCIIPDIRFWGEALYYTKSGKIVLDYLKTSLMWYDPKENTWEMFSVQDVRQWYHFALYVESLILPDWQRPTVA